MKFFVIGDTHGKLNKVRDIWPKLKDIDMLIHTGDYISDAISLEKELDIPVICVKGNCDGSSSDSDFEVVETECGNILVTHGHMEDVDFRLDNLMYKAMQENCCAAVFGHTHKARIAEAWGIHFVNPGSLTLPRDNSDGSYAIIRTSDEGFEASIVYYSTIMGGSKKPQSGYIRNMLNYSDRF